MAAGRWYPSVTPLTNGEMLITEGGPDTPEVRKTDGTLRTLSTASLNLPLYPWLDVAPDGRVFYSGPNQTMRKLDTAGGGSWQTFGQRDGINRNYGSRAVYDIGKTLVAGGGSSTKTAVVINSNGATPQVTATVADGLRPSPAQPHAACRRERPGDRWQLDRGVAHRYERRRLQRGAVGPRDGSVDHPRGAGCDTPVSLDRAAAPGRPRALVGRRHLRHLRRRWLSGEERRDLHTAVSVQERRLRAACTASRDHERAWLDQPRYVLPDHHAGRRFDQQGRTDPAGSQTHSTEMEQRYVPLSFTAGGGTLTASVPANMNTAVPGIYMLFIVDSAGVPSVASMVGLDRGAAAAATTTTATTTTPPPPPPPPPPPASGLAAAYSFNEGIGTSAADSSGNGNTGAIGSTSWITTGKYGNALSFNGSMRESPSTTPPRST